MRTHIKGWKFLAAALLILIAGDRTGAGAMAPLPLAKPLIVENLLTMPAAATAATETMDAQEMAAVMAAIAPAAGSEMASSPAEIEKAMAPPSPSSARTAALSARDAATYRKIFALQHEAQWAKADKLLKSVRDDRLRGHVLEQRYLHPSYKARFAELADWLTFYSDHPGAARIYRLATARKPKDHDGNITSPSSVLVATGLLRILSDSNAYTPEKRRSEKAEKEAKRVAQSVRAELAAGAPARAYKKLNADYSAKLLDRTEYDQLRALIASAYMYDGKHKKAAELAHASAQRSGNKAPLAGWVSGLVAWRQEQYAQAARYFELTATSPYASSWTSSAGAYWASRAHMRAGNVKEVSTWLRRAAQHPRTFYGLIATRSLGWDFDFNWDMPAFTSAHKDRIESLPAGQRAMALVAAGQYHLAEQELQQIDARKDPKLREALLAYAGSRDLPAFAMKMAESVPHPDGGLYDAALYPLSPWEPKDGYKVDRALIHAIIRQESRFNPWAESGSGAMGLMQLMPATAGYVAEHLSFKNAAGRHTLKDPQTNLDIGQRYVEKLLRQDGDGADLFSLAMAYNAGPGNMRKWKRALAEAADDPLLFVESIPMGETRAFVERVMANYWIYRLRMGRPAPSLDNVTGGKWALYEGPEGKGSAGGTTRTAMAGWTAALRQN